mmetsp:Transcript_4901/g.7219  ORF Transcript_4901/g.7219 Transcript_4901/m.7219 type:complete len:1062 (+) Transcript_4901:138-3323(+)|eukprot:CAMPEP_0172415076 /NCGR_PEP_ID=MMETSP1064-20121228/1606_1 /TAXON_ID=202472 /ORGANISM="Aulacoseira subarctica , Strain CCAP 1002/5" /LENGTH=1061 /DNA_ID=CAMNT_0013151973 /DNA_START=38 /DNA_END=3223 /DNA_ORIENTATION=-
MNVGALNVEDLHLALQQSFSPDPSLRGPSEELIKLLKYVPGATIMLLQVTAEKQVQYEVRQAAVIQLKNICKECWVERVSAVTGLPISPTEEGKPPAMLSEQDKEAVKTVLLETLLNESDKSIRDLLAETLHTAAVHEYPDKWPTLLPLLLTTIQTNGANTQEGATTIDQKVLRVHNALLALRKIVKRYEYKSKEQRGPLDEIVKQGFPLLLPLAQRSIAPDEHSLEAATCLRQILKIFWSSSQFYWPQIDAQQIEPWFDVLQAVMAKPLPEAFTGLEPRNQPTSIEERNAWPWWKVKKWAIQIMNRLFSRYGMPNYAEEELASFAKYFSNTVAPRFLMPVCETLNLRPSGQFCTDRVVHLCLSYVDLAVELVPTYKLLRPHLDFLLYQVCFPAICLTDSDVDAFENDPHEFVRKENSILSDYYDPRISAINLITDLVKHRGRDVTQKLLVFLNDCMQRYATAAPDQRNHIEKDGAFLALGSLSDMLLSKKKYSSQLEGLLVNSVFPDFNSPIGFLRYRACWMVQRFSSVQWTDDGTNLRNLIQFVLLRLSDPALPVQIEASKALRYLIEEAKGAEDTLLPVLPQLLSEYFRIMNEIGNDEVVAALQTIIDKFGDHIEPHSIALVTQLATTFDNYVEVGDDDDDAAMAAAQCLECISTVLKGICERPDLYRHLEPHLVPLITKILGNDGDFLEYLEYALDILTFLTYFPDTISPQLWECFPLVHIAFEHYAFDYLSLMVTPLDNFIVKDPRTFLCAKNSEGTTYIDLIFNMVAKTLGEDRASEQECRKALSLLMSVLLNCKGQVDHYLPLVNDITLAKLGQQVKNKNPLTRIVCFQVLGAALWYNSLLELQELEKRVVTQQVFSQWIQDSDKMEKWLPRKLSVLGLTSIILLPTSSLPQTVSSSLPRVIAAVVKITENMKNDAEGGDEAEEEDADNIEEEEEEDHGEEYEDEGFAEDEDVTDGDHVAYVQALSKLNQGGTDSSKLLFGEDWDQEDDDDADEYSSPIDDVDELLFMSETLKVAFMREPEVYQQVQRALSPNTVESCQKLFAAAEEIKAKETK